MKPSERIEEIHNKLREEHGISEPADLYARSVSIFLDEEYEKKQPKHFIHEHESDGMVYTSNPPQYKCKKCGEFYN